MSNTITVTLGGMLIASVMFSTPAAASSPVDLANPAFAPVSGPTSIPVGADDFCRRVAQACRPEARVVEVEPLTQPSWDQLVAINDNVNATVTPETDEDNYRQVEYWT
jgi:predicted transglutaminase-like cysteine proteinase